MGVNHGNKTTFRMVRIFELTFIFACSICSVYTKKSSIKVVESVRFICVEGGRHFFCDTPDFFSNNMDMVYEFWASREITWCKHLESPVFLFIVTNIDCQVSFSHVGQELRRTDGQTTHFDFFQFLSEVICFSYSWFFISIVRIEKKNSYDELCVTHKTYVLMSHFFYHFCKAFTSCLPSAL